MCLSRFARIRSAPNSWATTSAAISLPPSSIGSVLAGLSGALYTAWGHFIVPAAMALPAAAMPIIWVAVGGRKDLTATLIGTLFVLWLFQTLTVISQQYALIAIGALLLVTILLCPAAISSGSWIEPLCHLSTGVDGAAERSSAMESTRRASGRHDLALLEATGPEQALRWPQGSRRPVDFSGAARRAALPDRAERRRQEHLFRLILGRYPPTAGTVRFCGADITQLHAAAAHPARHERQDAGARCLRRSCRCARTWPSRCNDRFCRARIDPRSRPAADFARSHGRGGQAGGTAGARPEAMAGDRDGHRPAAEAAVSGRANRRPVARGDVQDGRDDRSSCSARP